MKRSGPLKRTPMKRWRKPKRTAREALLSQAWFEAVVTRAGSALIAAGEQGAIVIQAHHVIPQQVLRRRARELGLAEATLVWDKRVGVRVSDRRHQRHHSGHEPIRRAELDERLLGGILEFAREYGLEEWFDRHYPAMCPDCKQAVATHALYKENRCPVVVFRPTV